MLLTLLDRSTATQPASTKSESDFNLDLPMSETKTNNFSKAGGCSLVTRSNATGLHSGSGYLQLGSSLTIHTRQLTSMKYKFPKRKQLLFDY